MDAAALVLNDGKPVDEALYEEIVGFVSALLKCLKSMNLYEHAEDRYAEFLRPSFQKLQDILESYGSLPLKVTPFTLKYKGRVVYEDESRTNLTYKFYRDGIRFIIFRDTINEEEFLRFILLSKDNVTERMQSQEDMVTRFWKESFTGIDHIAIENFDFEDMDDEEVQAEVDKIVAYLREQLAANGEDITRFARLSVQDLDLELTDLEQVRGGIISGRTATGEDKARLQAEIIEEARHRIFSKMVLILFQVMELESRPQDKETLFESIIQLLDLLLVSDDMRGAVSLLHRFDRVLAKPLPEERQNLIAEMQQEFRTAMVESQRLDQIGQYLTLAKTIDDTAVKSYLEVCGEDEVIPLIDLLASLERPPARALLVDVLSEIGKTQPDVFARRLEANASSLVKDMLEILHRINPSNLVELVAMCLEHPNVMIRLEGLKSLSKSKAPESLRHIEKAMSDEEAQMRFGAFRAMAARDPRRASAIFIKSMDSPGFMSRDRRERITIATALGETKTEEAFDFFRSCFDRRSGVFNKAKVSEMKQMAVMGLSAMKNVTAFRLLNQQLSEGRHGREVLEACHKAALRLKERLEKERKSRG